MERNFGNFIISVDKRTKLNPEYADDNDFDTGDNFITARATAIKPITARSWRIENLTVECHESDMTDDAMIDEAIKMIVNDYIVPFDDLILDEPVIVVHVQTIEE